MTRADEAPMFDAILPAEQRKSSVPTPPINHAAASRHAALMRARCAAMAPCRCCLSICPRQPALFVTPFHCRPSREVLRSTRCYLPLAHAHHASNRQEPKTETLFFVMQKVIDRSPAHASYLAIAVTPSAHIALIDHTPACHARLLPHAFRYDVA